jgi:hypothetical protein
MLTRYSSKSTTANARTIKKLCLPAKLFILKQTIKQFEHYIKVLMLFNKKSPFVIQYTPCERARMAPRGPIIWPKNSKKFF